jgi:cell division protein FtsW
VREAQGQYDRMLFGAVLLLVGIGVVMVYSASSVIALTTYNDPSYFMKRQILWMLVGLGVMQITLRIDHAVLANKRVVLALLAVTMLLLVAAFLPHVGRTVNGARRWIRLGGFSFQPAELMKFSLVVYLSSYLSGKGDRIRDFRQGLVPPLVVTGTFLGIALLQPDFGTVMVMAAILFIMLFAGGARPLHLAGLVALAAPLVYVAVAFKAYRLRRIMSFLDPWADPQGAGHQIVQSYLAFGSGGLLGRGLGQGRQKLLFLPERHSDFIFAVIGEELGLWGALIVLLLFGVVLWRGLRIAVNTTGFSRLLAAGITMLISVQALINMAVVTGLMPTKGIALPLVSYGGSAIVVTLAATGVLLNISKECA